MQIDQLRIGNKYSFDDFGASVKERAISAPPKKSIKETVPFSNVTHDFSKINGEVYWEERELEYDFEILADTPEDLEAKKRAFSNWVMNVMNEEIYDPFETGWHYLGTFDDIDYEDEETLDKTTISVMFTAYPYKLANNPTVYTLVIPASSEISGMIENDSSHRISPTLDCSGAITLQVNGASYSMTAGKVQDDALMLQTGKNILRIQNPNNTDCVLTVTFVREVF